MTVITPTIHLNGSNGESLLADYRAALEAVTLAIAAVQRHASPHGRDYYPQGDLVINQAIAQHVERLKHLEAVRTQLEFIALTINEQNDARKK